MALTGNWPLTGNELLSSEILFDAAGLTWLFIRAPVQIKQARLARAFLGVDVGDEYRQLFRQWLIWGLIITVPLVMATWFMIAKPASGFY